MEIKKWDLAIPHLNSKVYFGKPQQLTKILAEKKQMTAEAVEFIPIIPGETKIIRTGGKKMNDIDRVHAIIDLIRLEGFESDYYSILLKEVFKILKIKGGVK